MDRFIGPACSNSTDFVFYLKSNMDRFIGYSAFLGWVFKLDLKSNMDRFIELTLSLFGLLQ